MKVLVTGAAGFLGTAVVRAARRAGHDVIALVRPAACLTGDPWDDEGVTLVRGDLRQRGPWTGQLAEADAVVHLAATPSGDLPSQFQATVLGTEQLLDALEHADGLHLRRVVHVSTFSVYDYAAVPAGTPIDEDSPLESQLDRRDAYAVTKTIQERLVRDWAARTGTPLVVVRPGAVYGPGADWDHGVTMRLPGGFGLVFGPRSRTKFVHVDDVATALVSALTAERAVGRTINVIDDDPPTYLQFAKRCKAAGADVPRLVPVPWPIVKLFGGLVAQFDRRVAGGKAKLPEFAARRRQDAQWKPFVYPNAVARDVLAWRPRRTLDDGVAEMVAAGRRSTR